MDHIQRIRSIQTFTAKLFLNDLERGILRRELATPFTPVEQRNAIHERISILTRQYKVTKSKLQWVQAEERLGRPIRQKSEGKVRPIVFTR